MFSKGLLLFLFISPVLSFDIINVNRNNIIKIENEITSSTSRNFLNKLNDRKHISNLYVYLNTPGGRVDEGMKIIREIKKYNISCIAEKAYSMGFAILQSCNKRYVTEFASIMQHQMHFGVIDEHFRVNSYLSFISQISEELDNMQSSRIGISVDDFRKKLSNNWLSLIHI